MTTSDIHPSFDFNLPEAPLSPSKAKRQAPRFRAPKGARARTARLDRQDYVRTLLRDRPDMIGRGPDSVMEKLEARFGLGISTGVITKIRKEVMAELAVKAAALPTPTPPTKLPPAPTRDLLTHIGHAIVKAIPGVMEFTLTVDDQGRMSIRCQRQELTSTSFVTP